MDSDSSKATGTLVKRAGSLWRFESFVQRMVFLIHCLLMKPSSMSIMQYLKFMDGPRLLITLWVSSTQLCPSLSWRMLLVPFRPMCRTSCSATHRNRKERMSSRWTLVLKEKEFRKLEPCIQNHQHRETIPKHAAQLIYQKAKDLWPTGKPEDVALRSGAPWAICKYCNYTSGGSYAFLKTDHFLSMLGTGFLIRGYVAAGFIEANVFSGSLPVLDTVSQKGRAGNWCGWASPWYLHWRE